MTSKRARPAKASVRKLTPNLTPKIEPEQLPAEQPDPTPSAPPQLDAHGFDPAEYDWLPVTRKPRKDGWSPSRQRAFIAALAESGSVEFAAQQVHMSPSSAHRLRRAPGAEQFCAAWDVALQHAARVLLDTAFERAFNGTSEPVFDRDGYKVGVRHRQNDRMLMFLLRAYMPERFRHAHRDWRSPDEALPPPPVPMAEALEKMAPVCPDEPHKLLPPDQLEDAVQCADILDGKLPHWREGKPDAAPNAITKTAQEEEWDEMRREFDKTRDNFTIPGLDRDFE